MLIVPKPGNGQKQSNTTTTVMTGVMLIHTTNTAAIPHPHSPRNLRSQLTNDISLMIAVMRGGGFPPALVPRPNRNATIHLSSSRSNMEGVLE